MNIPKWLKDDVEKQSVKNEVPLWARILSISIAVFIIVVGITYVVKSLNGGDSEYEAYVETINSKYHIMSDDTISYFEPNYKVVRTITSGIERFYIFDDENNLVYPRTIKEDDLIGTKDTDNP